MGGLVDSAVNVGEAIVDVPADAVNATTGTGENLGWFGEIDRALDPRNVADDEWADPSGATSGLSGFLDAGSGALTSLGSNVGDVTTDPILAFAGFNPEDSSGDAEPEPETPVTQTDMLIIGAILLIALLWAGGYL